MQNLSKIFDPYWVDTTYTCHFVNLSVLEKKIHDAESIATTKLQ